MKWLTSKIVSGVAKITSRVKAHVLLIPPTIAHLHVTSPISTTETSTTSLEQSSQSLTTIAGTTRPLDIVPGKSYQLSKSQFTRLWTAATHEGMVFLVPSPRFVDEPQHARDLLQLCQEFEDLLALELVMDVSDHYPDNVAEAWNEQGRHVRFMALSLLGKVMFEDSEKRPVN